MNKTLAGSAWLVLVTLSPAALAAALGQATTLSPLQAPLDARINLVDTDSYPVEQISATVADASAFNALGLEWSPLLSSVHVAPVRQNGRTHLRLTSQQAVNTPWLDVLITLTTPTGRQTQAVTLLFDPVDYLPGQSDADLANARPTASQSPTLAPPDAAPAARPPRPAASPNTSHATVRPGDTLWDIALRTRPPGVEVRQMIAALVEANQEMFAGGSIDSLSVGQRLRLPSRQDALDRSPQQAARSLSAHSDEASANPLASEIPAPPNPPVEHTVASTESLAVEDQAQAPDQPSQQGVQAGTSEGLEGEETGFDRQVSPASIEAALAVQDTDGALTLDFAQGLVAEDLLARVLAPLSPLSRVEAAPADSEYQALLDEQARQAAEIDALKDEIAGLRQTLGDVQALTLSREDALPTSARTSETAPGVMQSLRAYWVWWAGIGLALLLAAMVISRKRREQQWEPAPIAPAPSDSESAPAQVRHHPEPVENPPQETPVQPGSVQEKPTDDAGVPRPMYAQAPFNTEEEVAPHASAPQREALSDELEEERAGEALSTAQPLALESRALSGHEAPAPASGWWGDGDASSEPMEAPGETTGGPGKDTWATDEAQGGYPETLVPRAVGRGSNHVIDYQPESQASPEEGSPRGVSHPEAEEQERAPEETEWEIEEVAFKPRRRDNS